MKKNILYLILILAFSSCKKQNEWLDVKSNKADIVPATLQDYQAVLDNTDVMNTNYSSLGIVGSDNMYVNDILATTGGGVAERNAYKWASDIFENATVASEWTFVYKVVEYSNIVLDGISKIAVNDQNRTDYNNIKGSALFYRAIAFYHIAQIFSKPYNKTTATTDLGILLRLTSDVNVVINRSTVQQTYDQILSDLIEAESLLPATSIYKTRPSVVAVQMMLAKVYLNIGDYNKAKYYSALVINLKKTLIDFNTLNVAQTYPFPNYQADNREVVFFNRSVGYTFTGVSEMLVSKELYNLYSENDLRKVIFFRNNTDGTLGFRGRYTGNLSIFCGLGLNETYLILAESAVRTDEVSLGMNYLNELLKTRWKRDILGNNTYVNQTANNEEEALTFVLNERRKELPFTGNCRWEDLRRLNQDPRFAKTLFRTIAGQTYSLLPNDKKYVLPIPPIELIQNSVPQNPR
ncbi:MAG: RagB/SusD family nutrient uptake outer membrane protein [Sphingobacteriaceae bacterium]|nr:RagB/SusD family nutrient uptake outer membrane protein [Sphingobacteriaceae bacterium]